MPQKRRINLHSDYVAILTNNPRQRANMLQAVEEHRQKLPGFSKAVLVKPMQCGFFAIYCLRPSAILITNIAACMHSISLSHRFFCYLNMPRYYCFLFCFFCALRRFIILFLPNYDSITVQLSKQMANWVISFFTVK